MNKYFPVADSSLLYLIIFYVQMAPVLLVKALWALSSCDILLSYNEEPSLNLH